MRLRFSQLIEDPRASVIAGIEHTAEIGQVQQAGGERLERGFVQSMPPTVTRCEI
jgi:hypothetical protein